MDQNRKADRELIAKLARMDRSKAERENPETVEEFIETYLKLGPVGLRGEQIFSKAAEEPNLYQPRLAAEVPRRRDGSSRVLEEGCVMKGRLYHPSYRDRETGKQLNVRTWWLQYSVAGKAYWESTGTTDRTKAELFRFQVLDSITTGSWVPPKERKAEAQAILQPKPVVRVKDAIALLRDDYSARKIRSRHTMASLLARLDETVGPRPIGDLDYTAIVAYRQARLDDHAAHATVNHEVTCLKQALGLAVNAKMLPALPPFPKRLKPSSPRQGYLEEHQYLRLRTALKDPVYQALLDFALQTGARRREFEGLMWSEIDLPGGVIRLDPSRCKNGVGRVIPINSTLRAVLLARPVHPDCPYVFYKVNPDGSALPFYERREDLATKEVTWRQRADWRKAWSRATKKAGCAGLVLHDLRRTTVRTLLRKGLDVGSVMRFIGDAGPSMTLRYNPVIEEDVRRVADRMADAYTPPSETPIPSLEEVPANT